MTVYLTLAAGCRLQRCYCDCSVTLFIEYLMSHCSITVGHIENAVRIIVCFSIHLYIQYRYIPVDEFLRIIFDHWTIQYSQLQT